MNSPAAVSAGEGMREALVEARDWDEKIAELYQWTGSDWLSGTGAGHEEWRYQHYRWLCRLAGYLMAGKEAALKALARDAAGVDGGASDYVAGLERALRALITAAEVDMNRAWPEGVDGSEIDDAVFALRAKYPVIWTQEQVEALEAWQNCGWVHQLTCANRPHGFHDEDGTPLEDDLIPTDRGLFCSGCDYHQTHVPEMCFGPLPPSPESSLANAPIAQPAEEEA